MTNYDRLKQVMTTEKGADLLHWLENFAYWFDPCGWFEESEVRRYLSEDYKQKEEDAPAYQKSPKETVQPEIYGEWIATTDYRILYPFKCPYCGEYRKTATKFCPECGKKLR